MHKIVLGDPDSVGDEIFIGEFTGAINVTKLRDWCLKNNRQPTACGFELWNAKELLLEHDFDHTAQKRIDYLCDNPTKLAEPLLVTKWDDTRGVYVLDGWHRLAIFTKWAEREKREAVPFMALTVTQEEAVKFRPAKNAIFGDVRR